MDEILNSKTESAVSGSAMYLSVDEWHRLALEGAQIPVNLTLSGESMRPILRKNRDTVTVIPVYRRLKRGDIVLFRRNDGMNVIHRIAKIKGETVVTLGDNCVYRDDPVNISQVWGIAVSAVRNGKKIRLDSAVSRTFGVLPLMVRPFRSLWRKIRRIGSKIKRTAVGDK